MDGVRQDLPCTANAVLRVAVQNPVPGTGICRPYSVSVSQKPRFAFLDGDPEQRVGLRIAVAQDIEQLTLERDAVPVIKVHHDDHSRI